MVVDAIVYMYFVCLGGAAGISTVFFISWKLWNRMNNKPIRKMKKGVI